MDSFTPELPLTECGYLYCVSNPQIRGYKLDVSYAVYLSLEVSSRDRQFGLCQSTIECAKWVTDPTDQLTKVRAVLA